MGDGGGHTDTSCEEVLWPPVSDAIAVEGCTSREGEGLWVEEKRKCVKTVSQPNSVEIGYSPLVLCHCTSAGFIIILMTISQVDITGSMSIIYCFF